MTTLWSPRTLRKYLDTYQGTTPAESIAGYFFFPGKTGLNSSDGVLSLKGQAVAVVDIAGPSVELLPPISGSAQGNGNGNLTISGTSTDTLTMGGSAAAWDETVTGTSTYSTPVQRAVYQNNTNVYNTSPCSMSGIVVMAGDLIIVPALGYPSLTSISDGVNSYALAAPAYQNSDTSSYLYLYYAIAATSTTLTITVTSSSECGISAVEVWYGTNPQGTVLGNSTYGMNFINGISQTTGTLSLVVPKELVIGTWYSPGGYTLTDTAGFTIDTQPSYNTNIPLGLTHYVGSGTIGLIADAITLSSNDFFSWAVAGFLAPPAPALSMSGSATGFAYPVGNTPLFLPTLLNLHQSSTSVWGSSPAPITGVQVSQGNLIVVPLVTNGNTGLSMTDSASNSYIQIALSGESGMSTAYTSLWYAFANSSTTLTITASGSTGGLTCVGVYGGVQPTSVVDTSTTSADGTNQYTSNSSGSINTNYFNDLVICTWGIGPEGVTLTDTTGFTILSPMMYNPNLGLSLSQKLITSPTTGVKDTVTSASIWMSSVIASFKSLNTVSFPITGQITGLFNAVTGASVDSLTLSGSASGTVAQFYGSSVDSLSISGSASGSVSTADNASSLATLILTGSASGTFTALDSGTSSASLTISGQIAAAQGAQGSGSDALSITGSAAGSFIAPITGSGSDPLTLSGQITAAQGNAGTSTDLLSLLGAATGAQGNAGTSSDTLTLAGQITGSFIAPISGSGSDALSLSGQIAAAQGCAGTSSDPLSITGSASGNAGSGTSVCTLSITGSASGTVKDFIGTSTGSLALTGTAAGSTVAGSGSDALSISGSASGSIIDFTGTSTGALSLSGSASANRGAAGTSVGLNIPLSGSATGSQGNQGSSAASLPITGSSAGSVEDFTAYSIEVLSFSGSAQASRGVAGVFLTTALLIAGFCSGVLGESGQSQAQLQVSGSAQAKVVTVATSTDPLPPISGQATGSVTFTVHGTSTSALNFSGSATAQTSNPVSITPAYLVCPPARNWVCTAQQRSYLVSPPARVWTVSPAKRNYLVSPPARIWNV